MTSIHPVIALGALLLGLASCLMAAPWVLVVLAAALVVALKLTGQALGAQLTALRPWLPMAGVILLVHTLTTTAAAPLGTPSMVGALTGLRSLLRVGCTVGWLALYTRISSLDDLVGALRWWLRPLERIGFPGEDLGLALAIALGTAPVVLGEGRRIETVVRLRRSGPAGLAGGRSGWSLAGWLGRQADRARVVVPLVETLGRRAEALSLSLRSRRPRAGVRLLVRPPVVGLVVLVFWLALLVGLGIKPEVAR